jgi:EAL domain-containing protein (putative c-di-GMP-specific phosphodiesterase class I)
MFSIIQRARLNYLPIERFCGKIGTITLRSGDCNRSNDCVRQSADRDNPKNTPPPEANWLELWYQPNIDSRTLRRNGAEALLRMRHPHLGIVLPASFIPEDGDPRFQALSQFVIDQAIADWHSLFAEERRVDISINLPISFLHDPACLDYLFRRLPDHPAFDGIIVEVNGTEVTRCLPVVADLAKQMRFRKVAISIDDLGAEWPDLAGLEKFPFVEIKVDRGFVGGCARDRLKRNVCRQIIDLANHYGARTVAEGVETRADFIVAQDLGFDLIQGFLIARPMEVRQFARTLLEKPLTSRPANGR